MKHAFKDFSAYHSDHSGLFGLELEVEWLVNPLLNVIEGWSIKADDSLRHFGVEYVTPGPVPSGDLDQRIATLIDLLSPYKNNIVLDSPRTSFHVHMNNFNLTPLQLINNCLLYWFVEPTISQFCGKKRLGNLFCLRLQDAEESLSRLRSAIVGRNPFLSRGTNDYKYSSLNLAPNSRLGTVEFRCMAGDINKDRLTAWVRTLENIRKKSLEFTNPVDISNSFFRNRENLVREILHPVISNEVKITSDLCEENLGLLSTFVHSLDWKRALGEMESEIECAYIPTMQRKRARPKGLFDNPPNVVAIDRMLDPIER